MYVSFSLYSRPFSYQTEMEKWHLCKLLFQISAGKSHSAAWTCPPPPRRLPGIPAPLLLGTPDNIPLQYSGLSRYSVDDIKGRLRLLHHYSDIVYSTWRLLPLAATKVRLCLSCVMSPK